MVASIRTCTKYCGVLRKWHGSCKGSSQSSHIKLSMDSLLHYNYCRSVAHRGHIHTHLAPLAHRQIYRWVLEIRKLWAIIYSCLYQLVFTIKVIPIEFMFLGSSRSLFSQNRKKKTVWSTVVRGKRYLTLCMRISGYLHQHVHSLAKASSSDVIVAVAEPEMTESTFSAG